MQQIYLILFKAPHIESEVFLKLGFFYCIYSVSHMIHNFYIDRKHANNVEVLFLIPICERKRGCYDRRNVQSCVHKYIIKQTPLKFMQMIYNS